ncbi:hypothetical protein KEM54_001828 [Ascosphaera aggregata]|nr:hypothetical protein KEM54_001828 [Ascosphaera aggregata]
MANRSGKNIWELSDNGIRELDADACISKVLTMIPGAKRECLLLRRPQKLNLKFIIIGECFVIIGYEMSIDSYMEAATCRVKTKAIVSSQFHAQATAKVVATIVEKLLKKPRLLF